MTGLTGKLAAALADRYRIESHLGEGGMAIVYLAEDLKHQRKVAIKVLRPELAAVLGAERFLQEITTTAALQHPHILPLFDSGTAGSANEGGLGGQFLYYVMPFIDGETLRDRLNREKQLGVDEAVRIATDVADALDYAHRKNVIHRDIKPENILLHDGRPIVADFGIALAVSAAAGPRLTETGASVGTPFYMSPEQASGKSDVDGRSDIYALGCVVYEALTGVPPHDGSTAQAVLAKVLTESPAPVTRSRPGVPGNVDAAVLRALAKAPGDRFATASEFVEALKDPDFGTPTYVERRSRLGFVVAALAVASALAAWGWLRPDPPAPVARFALAWDVPLTGLSRPKYGVAIAPDGSGFVFVDSAHSGLSYRRRGQLESTSIAGTDDGISPFFSADGEWIAFVAGQRLLKVPIAGGAPIVLADSVAPLGGAWLDDGSIYFSNLGFAARRVHETGGPVEPVVPQLQAETRGAFEFSPLPDSRGVLITGCDFACRANEVYVYDADADTVTHVIENAHSAWFSPTGHIIYGSSGGLYAAAWDSRRLTPTSAAILLDGRIRGSSLRLSRNGTGLYVTRVGDAPSTSEVEPIWLDRSGVASPAAAGWTFSRAATPAPGMGWRLSPDQTRLAVLARTEAGGDIWVKQLPRGPFSRITSLPGVQPDMQWDRDGTRLSFVALGGDGRDLVLEIDPAASGEPEVLVGSNAWVNELAWSSDRDWLLLRTGGGQNEVFGARDILAMRIGVDSVPQPLLATPASEWSPAISPDGRWLAYVSDETGRAEIYVRPFPDVSRGKVQISIEGGRSPRWAHRTPELYYLSEAGALHAVRYGTGASFDAAAPVGLFAVPANTVQYEYAASYQVSADDQRFMMMRRVHAEASQSKLVLVLVENFFEEVAAKMNGR